MHGHDRLRARADPALDVLGIEVQRHRIDVGEDRGRAGARDGLGRRVEGEGGADHLVARSDSHRLERQHERVRPVRDADRVRHAEVGGGLLLERLHLGPEDEPARLDDALERLPELRDQRLVLCLDVDEIDLHGRESLARLRCGLASPTQVFPGQPGGPCHDQNEDHVVDVVEGVVEVLPAAAERPADAGEAEAPDRRAQEGQDR